MLENELKTNHSMPVSVQRKRYNFVSTAEEALAIVNNPASYLKKQRR